tara:strand:+ start:1599 stop:2408 length:810 start_codon:yes stop_codon:yes gene_type:complete
VADRFDVPSLSTIYLDKPLKAHTLMQAIARANRVHEGKNNGMIVDYCGILKHLRKALATFAGAQPGGGGEGTDPARPDEELLAISDLLRKNELAAADIKWIKAIATDLLETLKEEKLRVDQWREKESTRDAVKTAIHDFLYSDATGLPVDFYEEDEVQARADEVFRHVYRVYPTGSAGLQGAAGCESHTINEEPSRRTSDSCNLLVTTEPAIRGKTQRPPDAESPSGKRCSRAGCRHCASDSSPRGRKRKKTGAEVDNREESKRCHARV